jgi:hypothetical protein
MRPVFAAAALAAFSTSAFADCKADVAAIFEAYKSGGPFRVEMAATANGQTTKATAEVIMPDRFRVSSREMEMIMVKKKAWMKIGGSWQAMPGQAAAMMGNMIETGIAQGINDVKNVKCLGRKDYEGETYDAYSFTSTGEMMGIASTADVTMYMGDGALPAWMVVDGEAMGTKSKTVQKITPDASITIKPPK